MAAGRRVGHAESNAASRQPSGATRDAAPRPADPGLRRIDIVVMVALALAAVGLVAPMLAPHSLYRDDAWQALATRVPLGEVARVGVTAPGYAFVLRAWSALAGRGSLALQTVGLLAAVVGPMALYLVGRRLGHSRAAAVTAAVLLLSAVNQVIYAARVKPYVLDVVVAIVMLWLALRVLEAPARASRWIVLTGVAIAALAFSASTAPVAVTSLGVPALAMLVQRRRIAIPVACCAAYAAFLGVWYTMALHAVRTGQLGEAWLDARSRHAGGRVSITLRALQHFFNFQSPRPAVFVGATLACAVVVGAAWLVRRRGAAVAGLLVAPIVIAVGLQLAGKVPLGTGRTDLYLHPSSLLLSAAAIDAVAGWRPVRSRMPSAAGALAGLVVVPFLVVAVRWPPDRYPNTDVRSAAAFVRSEAGPTDRIVTAPELGYIYALYAPGEVGARADAASLTSFTPVVGDPRVLPLAHYSSGSTVATATVAATVASAARGLAPSARLWLLEFATVNAFNPVMHGALEDAGCRVTVTRAWAGVTATEWACSRR